MPNKQDKLVRNRDLINSFRPSIDAVDLDDDDDDDDDELVNEDSIAAAAAAVGLLASSLVAVFGSVVVSSLMSITKQVNACKYVQQCHVASYSCTHASLSVD